MNATSADDTLKIIGALLVIAVVYCLVEMVTYYLRRKRDNTHTHAYKKSHHPHQHHLNEQENEKRAALIDDILKHEVDLFKQPPQKEDCPICFLPIPSLPSGRKYKTCCGKIICSGCLHAVDKIKGETKCPFCRVPDPESEDELIERYKKRVEMDDAEAIYSLGCEIYHGILGVPQDWDKALELWHQAADLGRAESYYSIGYVYYHGEGVERDTTKAKHYWELAATGGNVSARYNLGILEERGGNMSRSLQHHIIAAGFGYDKSLKRIRVLYANGHATKDDYAKALQFYQKYLDGIKSAQRDDAAAFHSENYRCY